jgi:hypothetical protein
MIRPMNLSMIWNSSRWLPTVVVACALSILMVWSGRSPADQPGQSNSQLSEPQPQPAFQPQRLVPVRSTATASQTAPAKTVTPAAMVLTERTPVTNIPFLNQIQETLAPLSGMWQVTVNDLTLNTGTVNLEVIRTLQPDTSLHGILGSRWRLNWEQRLWVAGSLAAAETSAGPLILTFDRELHQYRAVSGERLIAKDKKLHLLHMDGSEDIFAKSGKLLEKIDRNQNRFRLTYSANGELARVDGPSQSFLQFVFTDAGQNLKIENSAGVRLEYQRGELDGPTEMPIVKSSLRPDYGAPSPDKTDLANCIAQLRRQVEIVAASRPSNNDLSPHPTAGAADRTGICIDNLRTLKSYGLCAKATKFREQAEAAVATMHQRRSQIGQTLDPEQLKKLVAEFRAAQAKAQQGNAFINSIPDKINDLQNAASTLNEQIEQAVEESVAAQQDLESAVATYRQQLETWRHKANLVDQLISGIRRQLPQIESMTAEFTLLQTQIQRELNQTVDINQVLVTVQGDVDRAHQNAHDAQQIIAELPQLCEGVTPLEIPNLPNLNLSKRTPPNRNSKDNTNTNTGIVETNAPLSPTAQASGAADGPQEPDTLPSLDSRPEPQDPEPQDPNSPESPGAPQMPGEAPDPEDPPAPAAPAGPDEPGEPVLQDSPDEPQEPEEYPEEGTMEPLD